ncbi:hypothetical protein LJR231_003498 [Phyllobacterium sp. LjRoot231]|uniref:hypothetical protein n=1 Tax=Phyllobacterium sp. LjRoot231 TaxID=3342289 RepID=UPI003ECDF579
MTAKIISIRASKAALAERNALLEQAKVIGDLFSQPLLGNRRTDLRMDYLLCHAQLAEGVRT